MFWTRSIAWLVDVSQVTNCQGYYEYMTVHGWWLRAGTEPSLLLGYCKQYRATLMATDTEASGEMPVQVLQDLRTGNFLVGLQLWKWKRVYAFVVLVVLPTQLDLLNLFTIGGRNLSLTTSPCIVSTKTDRMPPC